MSGYDTVSFLSDYGHDDEFVGVVHSVIHDLAPGVRVIDVTHGIAPHDVRAAGLALARAAPYLVAGVVVAVVDPGVGTERRAVGIEVGDGQSVLVGPDNGVLAPTVGLVGGATRAVELTDLSYRLAGDARTFDGRDVFAPAAAHLCNGVALTEMGPQIDPAGLRPGILPVSYVEDGDLVAEVLWVDRFGNCQLNLAPDEIGADAPLQLVAGDQVRSIELVDAFDRIGSGRVGLICDASGLMALAVARASAAADLGLTSGSEVRLRPLTDGSDGATTVGVRSPVTLRTRSDRNGGDS